MIFTYITISKNILTNQNVVDISLIGPITEILTGVKEEPLINFPKVSKGTSVSQSDLPVYFQNFIKENGIINLKIVRFDFVNRQTGFLITGIIPSISIVDAGLKITDFAYKNQWENTNNIKIEPFTLIEYKGGDYKIQISYRPKQKDVEINLRSIRE